jgi:hypothetical protein
VPRLGADGIAVLRDIAALPDTEIERMLAAGIIAGVRGEGGQATT